jgi:hypothetical protein
MAAARYRRSDRLVIHDADPLDPVAEAMTDPAVALARYRLAARQPEPAPPTMHVRRGLVRLDGVELDERQSARVLDLVGYDDVADR